MIPRGIKIKKNDLPETPGVYFMKDAAGKILYVGKAGNLKRRVESYFNRPHDSRIEKLVEQIRAIEYEQTDTAIEALVREAELIKKLQPPFNVREKDDTSFLYIKITKDLFPRVLAVRGKDPRGGRRFGPFTASSQAREALRIVRRIFPYSTHAPVEVGKARRPCFDAQIGLCPGVCIGAVGKTEYKKTIRHIILFLEGKKKQIVRSLERDMRSASGRLDFERAEKIRRQLFALRHIQDVALIHDNELEMPDERGRAPYRIEGYDISNISGTSSVGSMVVFADEKPARQEYRKFKIRTVRGSNDIAMLKEVMTRRLRNNWPLPDCVLVDGGVGQVNAIRMVLRRHGKQIPVVGIAKGPERKRNDVIGRVPAGVNLTTLIKVRDEAHRFAVRYHTRLRDAKMLL